jgi:hypothetical protein
MDAPRTARWEYRLYGIFLRPPPLYFLSGEPIPIPKAEATQGLPDSVEWLDGLNLLGAVGWEVIGLIETIENDSGAHFPTLLLKRLRPSPHPSSAPGTGAHRADPS